MAFLKSRTGVGGRWRREMPPEPSYSRSALMPYSRRKLENPRRKPPPRLPRARMGSTLTTMRLNLAVRRPVGAPVGLDCDLAAGCLDKGDPPPLRCEDGARCSSHRTGHQDPGG